AMACALPVVAAMAQGVSDILAGGEFGVMVPRGDATAMASALGRLVDNPGLAAELGQSARARAQAAFSLEAVGAQLKSYLLRSTDAKVSRTARSTNGKVGSA